MEVNAVEILNNIKNKISKRAIFQNSLEDLIKALIQAEINLMIKLTSLFLNHYIIDDCIAQFRTILKFIYLNSKLGSISFYSYEKMIREFENMIVFFKSKYTPVRNYLEQCALGKRKIEFDQKKNYFIEPNFNNASNYSRIKDKVKVFPSEEIKNHIFLSIKKVFDKNPKKFFRNRYVQSLMPDMIKSNWIDSEIKFNYEFSDFTYCELIIFCASIQLIGYYYFIRYETPVILKEDFIQYIHYLTELSDDKINFFLAYMIYDIQYQKDKLTLIQSLIEIENKIYFLPISLTIGMLPLKLYRSIIDYNKIKYEKDIAKIAKLKEKQMTEEIINCLKKYDVTVTTDFIYKVGEEIIPKAEYDILIFDNQKNDLYICECKWFFVGDGEEEHFKLDKKISNAIKERKNKNKIIEDNLKDFMQKAFKCQQIPRKISAFMLSQNYLGYTRLDLPVIDFDTLKFGVEKYEGFSELMEYIIKNEFVKSIELEEQPTIIEVEEYKFEIYMAILKKNDLSIKK